MPRELVYLDDVKHRLYDWGEQHALHCLEGMNPADATPVIHAHWVRHDYSAELEGYFIPSFSCSHCETISRERMNFCGECGALMDEEGDEG